MYRKLLKSPEKPTLMRVGLILLSPSYRKRFIHEEGKNMVGDIDHNVIWSIPRSGNHWVRFIAEYLSGCPTCGCQGNRKDIPIYLNTFPCKPHPLSHVIPQKSFILYKEHSPYPISAGSNILLLIRDYHEWLAFSDGTYLGRSLFSRVLNYLELIAAYHRFKGTKMIVYYEDLLTYPNREIHRIKDFLGASNERYKAFMDGYDDYVALSRQAKNRAWCGSHSKEDFKFHRNKLNSREIRSKEKIFHATTTVKEYKCVRPYIARYG